LLKGLKQKIPDNWDGISFFDELENNEDFGRDYLVICQNAWSCQRTVIFENWSLIRTYHTGMKDFPDIMLFDREKDFHMTKNIVEEKQNFVEKGLKLLNEWHNEMMKVSDSEIDPMWTVIKEGGPLHSRGMLELYIKRLKETGREEAVKKILQRNEPY